MFEPEKKPVKNIMIIQKVEKRRSTEKKKFENDADLRDVCVCVIVCLWQHLSIYYGWWWSGVKIFEKDSENLLTWKIFLKKWNFLKKFFDTTKTKNKLKTNNKRIHWMDRNKFIIFFSLETLFFSSVMFGCLDSEQE